MEQTHRSCPKRMPRHVTEGDTRLVRPVCGRRVRMRDTHPSQVRVSPRCDTLNSNSLGVMPKCFLNAFEK